RIFAASAISRRRTSASGPFVRTYDCFRMSPRSPPAHDTTTTSAPCAAYLASVAAPLLDSSSGWACTAMRRLGAAPLRPASFTLLDPFLRTLVWAPLSPTPRTAPTGIQPLPEIAGGGGLRIGGQPPILCWWRRCCGRLVPCVRLRHGAAPLS